MRIDSHQHFWCYNPNEYGWIDDSMAILRRDFLPGDLRPELQHAGFDGCIAVQARQTLAETRWLLQLAAASPFILGVIGWVDLRAGDMRSQLSEFAGNPKLLGVRHIVQSEPDDRFLLRSDFLRGIAQLEEFGLTYDILIYPRHLPAAAEFAERFPRQRFVLDHLAKPSIRTGESRLWESGIRKLANFPNVFCKISGMVTEADWNNWRPAQLKPYLDTVFHCFGPERLMIGSDWPVCTVAAPYREVMHVVTEYLADYPDTVRDAILGGNAQKLWRLEPIIGSTSLG
ncbi:MAG TPA: amidohydrolase family protein [Terriglobales bacterium]|jgi:L-fuconolactonase|nr:amidohydrolase family protein [Terriglobales bacterium]